MMRLLKRAKKLLETIVVAATMSLASTANAQVDPPHKNVEWAESNKAEARLLVLAANVAFGCLKSGIGSSVHGLGFLDGCEKGALAGAVAYAGEFTATYGKEEFAGASGKLIH